MAKLRKGHQPKRSDTTMAQDTTKTEAPAAEQKAPPSIGVRLVPNGHSDVPALANFARVNVSPSGVLVDLGFLDPAALGALGRMARGGAKMPESISGHLAGRFALTPDSLVSLHQQLGRAIGALQGARRGKETPK
jgi:hypothetical protein